MAFATLRANLIDHPGAHRFAWPDWLPKTPYDIGTFLIQYRTKLESLRGRVDLIAGGPPCQGFSLAGRRRPQDKRNLLFVQYIEFVTLVRPRFILIENVKGITVEFRKATVGRRHSIAGGRPYSDVIAEALEALGYVIEARVVRARDCGVPQTRPRFILAGIDGQTQSDAVPEFFKVFNESRLRFLSDRGLPRGRAISVRKAISDLETRGHGLEDCPDAPRHRQPVYRGPLTHFQRLLHGKLNGKSPNSLRLANHRPDIVERFKWVITTCKKGVVISDAIRKQIGTKKHTLVPLHPDRPSHTLTTLPDDILHYSEPRILSVREYARLQSFPDWFEFHGKYTTGGRSRTSECPRYTQVGNAVPPFLAEVLGRTFRRLLR